MVELEQYKYQWNQYADQLEELRKAFDIQAKKERIEENIDIFDFSLEEEDIKKIDSMNNNKRTGFDPMEFDF